MFSQTALLQDNFLNFCVLVHENIFAAEVSGEGHLSFLLIGILVGCYQTTMKKKVRASPLEDDELSIEDVHEFEYKLPSLL